VEERDPSRSDSGGGLGGIVSAIQHLNPWRSSDPAPAHADDLEAEEISESRRSSRLALSKEMYAIEEEAEGVVRA
jgi:hypothetical protein